MNVRTVADLGPDERSALFDRDAGVEAVRDDVADIVDAVSEEGDVALRRFASEFDDVEVGNIDITDAAERAYEEIDDELVAAIGDAAQNIRTFHERQRPEDWRDDFEGRELGRRFRPLDSAGVYAPGGTAAYPSSALPAQPARTTSTTTNAWRRTARLGSDRPKARGAGSVT